MKKLVIEARLNEFAGKAANPNVPWSPDEIADAAVACHDAGAAIAHFHARRPDGSESNETADFAAIIAGIRERCPMLVHPTLGRFGQGVDPDARLSVIAALAGDPALRPDIAPLDIGSANLDRWDPVARRFLSDNRVYVNTAADLRAMANRLRGWGIVPQLVLWSLAGARLMRALHEMGTLGSPLYPALLLTGEGLLFGHPADAAGLRAHLDAIAGLEAEWTVMMNGASWLPLLPEVIAAGGHVAIGLGDYPYLELGRPTNADLIARVVAAADDAGRPIASPAEARAMLGCHALAVTDDAADVVYQAAETASRR